MKGTKSYCVSLKSKGRITQLPDSQQLFGALAYLIKDIAGEATVSDFVENVKNYRLNFTLSSLHPAEYLPVPKNYLQDQLEGNKKAYKALKHCQFLKLEQLKKVLQNPDQIEAIEPYITIAETQQIHASIESSRYDVPGLNPNIYSVPELTILEVQNDRFKERITEFEFYFTVAEDYPLVDYLKQAQENGLILTLGPRSTQGLNVYSIQAIAEKQEAESLEASYCLNLGRLLPEKINFQTSYLNLFTSERRPFQNYGKQEQKKKQFISFIESGSIISLDQGTDVYSAGKSITSPFDYTKKSIVFGQSFLYPITLKEEKHG